MDLEQEEGAARRLEVHHSAPAASHTADGSGPRAAHSQQMVCLCGRSRRDTATQLDGADVDKHKRGTDGIVRPGGVFTDLTVCHL